MRERPTLYDFMIATDSYTYHYLFIGIFLVVALVFPVLPIILAYFVAPKKPSASKNATYECGMESEGDAWIQFRVQYYIFALLFVVFDIETVFIFPAAIAFRETGLSSFVALMLFIVILAESLIWAWKKNILEWE